MKNSPAESEVLLSADFSDLDLMLSTVNSWDLDFSPLSKHHLVGSAGYVSQSICGDFSLARAQFSISLEQRGSAPFDCYTFVIIDKFIDQLWWRGRDHCCDEILVYSPGVEISSTSGTNFAVHTISVPENLCMQIISKLRIDPVLLHKLPNSFPLTPEHAQMLRYRAKDLSGPLGVPSYAYIKAIVEDIILLWVKSFKAVTRGRPTMRRRKKAVRQSLEYLERHDWADTTTSDLCHHTSVSERTLQYAFKERFGLTPAAFVKARRLAAVQQELKSDNNRQATIGDIAANFGFWHLGQFAADYRRLFGELPTVTHKR